MKSKRGADLHGQIAQLNDNIIPAISAKLRDARQKCESLSVLVSVAKGVYDEADKLCKKAPAEQVTELALDHVNHVINETKMVANDDPFIARITAFVPAGDNPEQRDVVLILRQIIQGLERAANKTRADSDTLASQLQYAKGIALAIELKLDERLEEVSQDLLNRYDGRVPKQFIADGGLGDHTVDFDQIARADLASFFGIAQ